MWAVSIWSAGACANPVDTVNRLWPPTVYWVVMSEPEVKEHESAVTLSFESFFMSAFAKVRAATARITGPDLAEDLAVEAFARAFARWGRVSKMESPEGWVVRVATNAALDETTVAKMAQDIGHARQSVQRIADILATEGLVSYEENPTDRRARILGLTSDGAEVLAEIYQRQVEWSLQIMQQLSPAQLVQIANKLEGIAQVLETSIDASEE